MSTNSTPGDLLTCQELVELVTAYLEMALPTDERTRFEQHLSACPHCRLYLEQMRQTLKAVGTLSESAIDDQVREDLLAAFRGWKTARR